MNNGHERARLIRPHLRPLQVRQRDGSENVLKEVDDKNRKRRETTRDIATTSRYLSFSPILISVKRCTVDAFDDDLSREDKRAREYDRLRGDEGQCR